MKILSSSRGIANLHVVARGQLQIAFDASARMFRTLSLIAVRQQHHEAREQIPFVFARGNELVDDDLRAVGEISELRFPQNQSLGVIAAESILESDYSRFRKRRIIN